MTVISVDVPKSLSDLVSAAAEASLLSKAAYVRTVLLEAARRDLRKKAMADAQPKEGG